MALLRRFIAPALGVVGFTTAAAADKLDAKSVWAMFAEACTTIVAAPLATPAYAKSKGWEARHATSIDGFTTVGSIVLTDMVGKDIRNISITYGTEAHAGGRMTYCQLHLFASDAKALTGVFEAAKAGVGAVLGSGYSSHGGTFVGSKVRNARTAIYTLPGFPPPGVLRVQQFDRVTMLNLSRQTPKTGN